jgi:hypothetical protein
MRSLTAFLKVLGSTHRQSLQAKHRLDIALVELDLARGARARALIEAAPGPPHRSDPLCQVQPRGPRNGTDRAGLELT